MQRQANMRNGNGVTCNHDGLANKQQQLMQMQLTSLMNVMSPWPIASPSLYPSIQQNRMQADSQTPDLDGKTMLVGKPSDSS